MTAPLLASLQDQLGARYTIERELGRGGMGAVYLARDRKLDRQVALKVLPPDIAADAGLRERFLRETRLVAGFSHPNIVPVFAVEEDEGLLAFAMGFVEGESLTTRVQRGGPLTSREAVRLLQDIGYALAYAHGRGIVHRDLKPDNIMLERATGRALLMDFGIARTIDAPAERQGLTRVGEVVGTPEYMSPEQAVGDMVDGRSDLYSLALVAFFALTGTQAITGESTQRVLVAQLTQPIPSIGVVRTDVPAALAAIIDQCAAKEPEARFASAEALVEALDAAQLAAPDVAIPIRQFGEELDAVPVVLAIGLYVASLLHDLNEARGWELTDGLTSITAVVAIVVARLAHVWGVRRRLGRLGFDGSAIHGGLRQLFEERAGYRDVLRMQPGHVRRERLLLAVGLAMVLLAVTAHEIGRAGRTQIGPQEWIVPTWVLALFFLRSALVGVGIVLIARLPLGVMRDRFMPRFWLGPIGRRLFRLAAQDGADTTGPQTPAVQQAIMARVSGVAARSTRPSGAVRTGDLPALRAALRTIEAHVEALESQDRDGAGRPG